MVDDPKKDETAERVAALERELADQKAKVKALEAAQPKPEPTWEEREAASARFRDEMHQMREGRMAYAMHPSVVRDMAGGVSEADCADLRRASHRPTGPSSAGAIPSSQQVSNVRGTGTGWQAPIPLSNPPGTNWVDAIAIADDVRQRAELARKKE
jgi:hypothetical protein